MKTAKNYILASLPTISRFSINLPSCAPLHRASLPLLRAPAPAVVCLQGGGAEQCRAAALASAPPRREGGGAEHWVESIPVVWRRSGGAGVQG